MSTPTVMAAPHPPSLIPESKASLRLSALALRDSLPRAGGDALAAHLVGFLGDVRGKIVAGTWPIGSEIDVRPALHALIDAGARIALPVTPAPGSGLWFVPWRPGQTLIRGRFGTSHPQGAAVVPDLLLVPLLAFDAHGRRLGYGGGYYDRTLAGWPDKPAIGCAYAAQQLDAIPIGPYDARLKAVVTENGVIHTQG